jgi:hypothetical protein
MLADATYLGRAAADDLVGLVALMPRPVHGTACTWVSSDPAVADLLPDSYRAALLGSEAA